MKISRNVVNTTALSIGIYINAVGLFTELFPSLPLPKCFIAGLCVLAMAAGCLRIIRSFIPMEVHIVFKQTNGEEITPETEVQACEH